MTPSEQDKALEAQILAKGLSAPRVMPEQIDDLVNQLSFHTYVVPGTTVTVAAAIAPGNIVVALGKSGAASAANFDEVIGRNRAISRAKDAARNQLWELEGYRLKRNLLDLQECGALDQVLDVAAGLPAELSPAWPASTTPAAALCQVQGCGHLMADASACKCPGGPCSHAISFEASAKACSCSSCSTSKVEASTGAAV